ncbi:MAG: tubulin-like doman-containing protein [Gemmataceae bacterium]
MSSGPLTRRTEPIPGYTLLERIGGGGFGEVYKCLAPGGIHKAIKFVHGDLEGAADEGKAAEQELKALKRVLQVRHPYILSIERYDIIEGRLLIVMELADRNLWDRYRECRTQGLHGIPRDELLRYMEETAEALDLMNSEHQLQHLDIKPQNIFLVHNHVKVADFGLAKDFEGGRATVTGGVTPVYAAPETFEGWISRYCDQYSLAIVYQELLTGVRPFNGTNNRMLMLQHIQQPPDLMALPEGDRAAIGRALAKKPDDRFPTCTDMLKALRVAALPATPVADRTPLPAGLVPPPMPSRIITPLPPPMPSAPVSLLRPPRPSDLPKHGPVATQLKPAAPATQLRPAYFQSVGVSQLPVAPVEKTGDGSLLPAVVIGIGKLGGLVLQRLRTALTERFGDPTAAPHLQLLAIDTDADDAQTLIADKAAPFDAKHLILAKLNRPSHYVRGVPGIESWMDQGLLYRLPRNPTTGGLRAFGRLALADHGRTVFTRIKSDLDSALDPTALAEADRATGLGLRSNRPRVYVVASPAGGTGGGMFLDLAYLARHALLQLGYAKPEVVGVLLLPPADRGRPLALANTYAALTELAYFSTPGTRYEFRYSSREPSIVDPEPPFARILALPLPAAADPAHQRQSAGLTAGLIFRELLAPLGRAADTARAEYAAEHPTPGVVCQTVGVYRFSWPRRRLQRRAALRLGESLLRVWMLKDATHVKAAVQTWLDEQWESRHLRPELIIERLQDVCATEIGQVPDAKFESLVGPLAERTVLGSKLDAWSVCHVLDDVFDLVGKPAASGEDAPAPALLENAVAGVAAELTAEYAATPAQFASHFTEQPGYRLPAAEEVVRQFAARTAQVVQTYEDLHKKLGKEAHECYARLFPLIGKLDTYATAAKQAGAASEVLDLLRAYPKKRYQAMVAKFVLNVYRSMVSEAPECLREVNFCRQRLSEVQTALEQAATADAAQGAALGPGRDLFPGGGATVDEAARNLVESLAPEELLELDTKVQYQVRRQFKAVSSYCVEASGQSAPMAELFARQCEEFLAPRLAEATAAEVFFQHYSDAQTAQRDLAAAFGDAEPELQPSKPNRDAEVCIFATPAGDFGDNLQVLAAEAMPDATLLPADSRDDVVVYRELRLLPLAELPQLGPTAREAYESLCGSETPPHARADIAWGG